MQKDHENYPIQPHLTTTIATTSFDPITLLPTARRKQSLNPQPRLPPLPPPHIRRPQNSPVKTPPPPLDKPIPHLPRLLNRRIRAPNPHPAVLEIVHQLQQPQLLASRVSRPLRGRKREGRDELAPHARPRQEVQERVVWRCELGWRGAEVWR